VGFVVFAWFGKDDFSLIINIFAGFHRLLDMVEVSGSTPLGPTNFFFCYQWFVLATHAAFVAVQIN
jgi:hypothetical protein